MGEMGAGAADPGRASDRIGQLLSASIELMQEALQIRGWASSDAQVMENVRAAHRATSMLEALRLASLRQLDARPEAVPGAAAGSTAATFMVHALNVSPRQASRDVAVAKALDPEGEVLPEMGAALAEGAVSRAHAEVAVSTLARIPAAIKKMVDEEGRTGLQRIDAFLSDQARTLPPSAVSVLASELVSALDPDREADRAADAYQRRGLTARTDAFGMLQGSFALDPVSGASVMAALQRFAKPLPAGPADNEAGQLVLVPDRRSKSQRQADALTEIAEIALRSPAAGDDDGPGDADDTGEARDAGETSEARDVGEASEARDAREAGEAHEARDAGEASEANDTDEKGDTRTPDRTGEPAERREPSGGGQRQGRPACLGRVGAELLVLTSLEALRSALGAPDPSGAAPGLARMSSAGTGDGPGAILDPETLARFACDGLLRRVLVAPSGAVLNLGRAQRLATPGQRKALAVRDGGCVIPGCTAPAGWSDVHHVLPWSAGGATDLDNLVLVCGRHHTAVHAGEWQILMHDGVPWVRPPTWVDVLRRPLRNTAHQRREQARDLGSQLRLNLATPPPADSGGD